MKVESCATIAPVVSAPVVTQNWDWLSTLAPEGVYRIGHKKHSYIVIGNPFKERSILFYGEGLLETAHRVSDVIFTKTDEKVCFELRKA